MGSRSSAQTQTQVVEPANAPYVRQALGFARDQFLNQNPQYYPNQTYADLAPQTIQSLNMQEQQALAGSPTVSSANQYLEKVLTGGFSPDNPAFVSQVNQLIPQIESQFGLSGRTGGLAQTAKTQAIANALGNQFNNSQQQALQAAQLAPAISDARYGDAARLGQVGQAYQDFQTQQIQDAMNRYNYNRDIGRNLATQYSNIANNSNLGYTQTASTPIYRNPGLGAIGGGLGGLQIANQIPGLSAYSLPISIGAGLLGGFF